MNCRKHPNDLSQKQKDRRLVFAIKAFHEEVEGRLLELRQSYEIGEMAKDKSNVSLSSDSNESQNIDVKSIQDGCLNFDAIYNYLSSVNSDAESIEISHYFNSHIPEESIKSPMDEINSILYPKVISNDTSIDYFDLIMQLQYDEEEISDSDEEDTNYFDELSSMDKKSQKYMFMNNIRTLCIDYIHIIPHTFIKKLSEKLKQETGYPFPKDPRTFLKTPRKSVVVEMGEGQYCHYGIESALCTFLTTYKTEGIDADSISLMANIDGARLANSSADGTWIITVSENRLNLVEVVGIHKGEHKPADSNDLVHMFVDELSNLINNGIVFNKKKYSVKFQCLVCDAPAKSYILKTKQHNGYYSCSKCTVKGVHENHKLFFPKYQQEHAVLRTDQKFLNQEYEHNPDEDSHDQYQIGETLMKKIPGFRPITDVVLDYMHLVCSGIMLKLLMLWVQDPKCILSDYQRQKI